MFKKALIVFMTAALLCGCGSGSADGSSSEPAQTAFTAPMVFDMLEQSGICPELDVHTVIGDEDFDASCEKLYGVGISEISDGGIMFVSSGKQADEISMLKPDGDLDAKALLEKRIDARYNDFEGYAPEELDKIRSAEIFEYGGYEILIISDNKEKISEKIKEMK